MSFYTTDIPRILTGLMPILIIFAEIKQNPYENKELANRYAHDTIDIRILQWIIMDRCWNN